MRRLLSFVVVCFAAVSLGAGTAAAAASPAVRPVPSLTPQATARLWTKLVQRKHALVATDCRPVRGVFYTQTDWMRLATRLAAGASDCGQFSISIPPLAGDKTTLRGDTAWRIRALGPNFHALAEIHYTAWSNWVTANASTFYAAGQEARRRMVTAGYDVTLGDGWALNELSSAVRRGDGTARQNVRDLVRGLYEGDGTVPRVKGAVYVNGIGQSTGDLSVYKANLQSWLLDAGFWADMSTAVSDWSQEVYGDIRDYAVPGASPATRRDELAAYLGHELNLANAGPADVAPARAFLQASYSPLANAAWAWTASYGYTSVPVDQMQDFVTAQVAALRAGGDHFGFAWVPSNSLGLAAADYTAQTAAILDRLSAALRDPDPCAASCTTEVAGAAFNEGWKSFSAWTQPSLTFATAPATLTAGTASGGLTVQGPAGATVTLASSAPTGTFSGSATGPWTATLSVAAGSSFFYTDTKAGSVTITASSPGASSATQTETIAAAALAKLAVTPGSATLVAGGTQAFAAAGSDAYGNAVAVTPTWTTTAPGTLSGSTFTASGSGSGAVTATSGGISASAAVSVTAPVSRVSSIAYGASGGTTLITLSAVRADTSAALAGATVSITLYRNGTAYSSARGTTGTGGKLTFSASLPRGCWQTRVTALTATGFTWDGATPQNQLCK
jgi:hypothetical protein